MGCQMNKRETNSDHEMLIFCLKILFIRVETRKEIDRTKPFSRYKLW